MFWKFNLITTSHVETLLSKENVTLKELMDEDDILQECKAQNKKLVDFLVQPQIMDEMVSFITQEPSFELDEVVRYKYSNIACELLTSDVCGINDALASDHGLLSKLLTFLDRKDQDGPLNPLLASFFSKTVSLLITRKTQPMFEFLQGRDDFVPLLLEHLETSAVTDLLLRLVTCTDNNESRIALVKWLSEQHLVERLIGLISPSQSEDRNTNAAQALCDIVRVSREHMSLLQEKADPDPLLAKIECSETISKLLESIFDGEKKESVLVSGILVILALLEFKKQGPAGQYQTSGQSCSPGGVTGGQGPESSLGADSPLQCFASLFFRSEGPEIMTPLDAERLSRGVSEVVTALTPRLADLTQLLKTPPQKSTFSSLVTPPVEQPVGWTRLEVAHLLSALLNTNTHNLNQRLAELNTIPSLLDLFFFHSWNNFLHTQVEQAVGTILRNPPTSDNEENNDHPLLDQLFSQCKIVQRLLNTWEENEQEQSQPGKHRRGYMGHLTNIANHLVRNSENGPNAELIQSKLKALPDDYSKRWETFTTEVLAEINKRNQTPLVSGVPSSILDGDCVDFRELHVPFQQDKQPQKALPSLYSIPAYNRINTAYSDYQMENMTNSFVDQFGFNDDEFVETDESIPDRLSRIPTNFQLDPEESSRSAELFEQTCRERIASLGDGDSDEDVWEEKELSYEPGVNPQSTLSRLKGQGSSSLDESSSDSEGEEVSSDSTHILSHPLGILGISGVSTPDSPVPVSATTGSMAALTAGTNIISSSGHESRHFQEDHKMEVDSTELWSASYEGTAMDTSNPWDGGVVLPPISSAPPISSQARQTSGDAWADFSCFTLPSAHGVSSPRPQAATDTNKNHTEDACRAATAAQSKVELGAGLPTHGGPALANGQVPIMASGPVVVVVGNPPSSTPVPAEGSQQPPQPGSSAPHTCPATPPPSPVASNKFIEDSARTSPSTLLETGSLEENSNSTGLTSSSSVVHDSGATPPPASPPACVQNGPI